MANTEHVEHLRQSVAGWNAWRAKNPGVQPDLRNADLSRANLTVAHLRNADLSGANLSGANLFITTLGHANLSNADLSRANLSAADLSGANLTGAHLTDANLNTTNLRDANLSGATMSITTIANVDLRTTKGLTEIVHEGPSIIQLHSVRLPQDGGALHFLQGAGIPDEYIDVWRSTMMHPIQYYSLFICYSSKDETLARRLHNDLQATGVRCWFAPEDLKIGDRFHSRINEAIHMQDKLLLLISEHAIQSDWVEIEVRAALEKEQRQRRNVLFPIRLDGSVLDTSQAWATMLRQSRHIGDFTTWMDTLAYEQAFKRLLKDLKQEAPS